jgi:hypothetical protein
MIKERSATGATIWNTSEEEACSFSNVYAPDLFKPEDEDDGCER